MIVIIYITADQIVSMMQGVCADEEDIFCIAVGQDGFLYIHNNGEDICISKGLSQENILVDLPKFSACCSHEDVCTIIDIEGKLWNIYFKNGKILFEYAISPDLDRNCEMVVLYWDSESNYMVDNNNNVYIGSDIGWHITEHDLESTATSFLCFGEYSQCEKVRNKWRNFVIFKSRTAFKSDTIILAADKENSLPTIYITDVYGKSLLDYTGIIDMDIGPCGDNIAIINSKYELCMLTRTKNGAYTIDRFRELGKIVSARFGVDQFVYVDIEANTYLLELSSEKVKYKYKHFTQAKQIFQGIKIAYLADGYHYNTSRFYKTKSAKK